MKATTLTMKSVTVTLIDSGIEVTMPLEPRPDTVMQGRSWHTGYWTVPCAAPQGVTQGEWDFIIEIIDYSINEGEDMQREVLSEGADDCHPSFRYQVN